MRREDQARDMLPVSRNGERALSPSWWTEHGCEDGGGDRAYPTGGDETRAVLRGGEGADAIRPGTVQTVPGGSLRV